MLCCESMATAGFKVVLKSEGLSERFKGDVGFNLPWHEFGCMGNLTGIVFCEAGAEVGSAADVALGGMGEAAEDVGVVHVLFLSLAILRLVAVATPVKPAARHP